MDTKYIHYRYAIGILIVIIIALASIKWSNIPELADKLSFALTLASLVLAVVAIGYAIYSNDSLARNVNEMNNASRDISHAATEVTSATNQLSSKIESIPPLISNVGERVEATHLLIEKFSQETGIDPTIVDKIEHRLEEKFRDIQDEFSDKVLKIVEASSNSEDDNIKDAELKSEIATMLKNAIIEFRQSELQVTELTFESSGQPLFGHLLRAWRHDLGLTLVQTTEKLEKAGYRYDNSTLSKYEQGLRRPTGEFLAHLSIAFDISEQEISDWIRVISVENTVDMTQAYLRAKRQA